MADDKRYYRTEIPNIIDDLGLDPHERALYVHYKRSCGGDDCEWVESARITAQRTKMSHTRASQARTALVKRGLITVSGKGNDGTAVKVVDVWKLNNAYYSYKDGRPDIDGWTINQLSEWAEGVNNIYTLDQERVSEPVGVNNAYAGVNIIYNKKEPLESLPKGNSGKEPQQPAEENIKGPKTVIKDSFLEYSKLPWPGLKKEQSFWWGQFGEIARIFNNDSDKAVRAIKSVIDHMRKENLSVVSPKSIVNLCRQVASGQSLNGRDSPGGPGVKVNITGSAKTGFNF